MQYVILDTSSIVFALSNNVDPFDKIKQALPEAQILISQGIVKELGKLADTKGKFSKYARVAISLLNSYPYIKIDKDSTYVDGWILRKATEIMCPVITNDTKLKKALKSNNIKVYSISMDGSIR